MVASLLRSQLGYRSIYRTSVSPSTRIFANRPTLDTSFSFPSILIVLVFRLSTGARLGPLPTQILPSIQPSRALGTPPRAVTNPLPAELALDLLLHNRVPTDPLISHADTPKHHRGREEPYQLIEKVAIGENHGAVVKGLGGRVVPAGDGGVVVGTALEEPELDGQVAGEEGEKGDNGEEDVGYERGC